MRSIFLATMALSVIATTAFGQGVDPLIGTWKMNLEKSTSTLPLPKSQTFTWSGEGQNLIDTVETVDGQGQASKAVFMHIYDGMPHPSTGNPDWDSSAYTRIGNTINIVRFKNGKPVNVGQGIIVPGKTFTLISGGIDANNRSSYAVGVYDRK